MKKSILIFILFLFSIYSIISQNANNVYDLLMQKKYTEAEKLAKELLIEKPHDLVLLAQLDVALNAQKKYLESEKLHDEIIKIWNSYYKDDFIKKGSPIGESSWARIVTESNDYFIISCEYYMPEKLGEEEPTILNFYKFIVQSKKDKNKYRLFKLEMSNVIGEYYVLSEISNGGFSEIIPYGSKKPSIFKITNDLIEYLNN